MDNGIWDERVLQVLSPEGDYLLVNPATDLIGYAGWQWISRAAHDGLVAAAKEFRQKTGKALYVREAFRCLDTQKYYYKHPQGGVAAVPGTSIHGFGDAIDVWSGVDTSFSSSEHVAFEAISKKYGWSNTGRNFGEPWHFQFSVADVTTSPAGTGDTTTIPPEDELPSTSEVADAIFNDPRFRTIVNQEAVKVVNGGAFEGAVKSAIDEQLPASLSAALDTVTVPYAPSKGAASSATTNLRNLFKDLRNKIFNG
jgi:hypothetical protein